MEYVRRMSRRIVRLGLQLPLKRRKDVHDDMATKINKKITDEDFIPGRGSPGF